MKAIVTLVHGTWAPAAQWTSPDSPLCSSLRRAAAQMNHQIEFHTHTWSGANSVRAREEAARTLEERLLQDMDKAPNASHFLIAHSHGGNIAIDAARAERIADRLSGIVTMSTPFVSCRRRSGVRVVGVLLSILYLLLIMACLFFVFSYAPLWIFSLVSSYTTSLWIILPLISLLTLYAGGLLGVILALPIGMILFMPIIWMGIGRLLDSFQERFDHSLKHPVPMLCVRFRMDEAIVALWMSRLLVKPIRIVNYLASTMAAVGGTVYIAFIPIGFFAGFLIALLDPVFGTHLGYSENKIVFGPAIGVEIDNDRGESLLIAQPDFQQVWKAPFRTQLKAFFQKPLEARSNIESLCSRKRC